MLSCEVCGTRWREKALMESEGLEHFYSPNMERKIVEKSGQVWVVKFGENKHIHSLRQCRSCPPMLGSQTTGDES
jgi:hypothetical protein